MRISLFDILIDRVDLSGAVERVLGWTAGSGPCRYVVTPNVDHIVMLNENASFRAAYQDSSLVLADGWPIVSAARLLGKRLPGRVAGSDLVPALFNAANSERRLRVYLLGAGPGVADRAANNIHQRWPAVQVVGTYSPPLGFEKDDAENAAILERIRVARPDVLLIGLGAPKQELWIHRHRQHVAAPVALCIGATIDFLAGEKRRAPVWVQRLRLEWLHRLCSEPKRLARRYGRDAWIYPRLVLRQYFAAP